jgi:hypothetical protein
MWFASDAIQELLGRLSHKVAGETIAPFDDGVLQARAHQLDEALAAASSATSAMTPAQQRFFSVNALLGLQVAQRQTAAALKLAEALRAPDVKRLWQLALEARTRLEQLETELARAEYPPFDRWYGESWIRAAQSPNNPHRPYQQLRDFLARQQ